MPLHHEPRDGDYAAYVDRLVNGREASPGAVRKAARRRVADTAPDMPQESLATDRRGSTRERRPRRRATTLVRRDHNSHTKFENIPADENAPPASLGPEGSPRLAGLVQIAIGIGALLLFMRIAVGMTYSHDPFALHHIVPLVLLGFIVRMFLARGNARLRDARRRQSIRTHADIDSFDRTPPL